MCPCLNKDRQILIGPIDLDADVIVECYQSRSECHAQAVTQQSEHDQLGLTLLVAVTSRTALIITGSQMCPQGAPRGCCVRSHRGQHRVAVTATKVIDDLAAGRDITAQPTSTFQPTAHLVDRLPRAHSQPMGKFVVINGNTAPSQLIQDAQGDGRLGHMSMIANYSHGVTERAQFCPRAPDTKARSRIRRGSAQATQITTTLRSGKRRDSHTGET
jgi:hypothetical protein